MGSRCDLDPSGVIHGCYAPSNGEKLRAIDTAKTMKCLRPR